MSLNSQEKNPYIPLEKDSKPNQNNNNYKTPTKSYKELTQINNSYTKVNSGKNNNIKPINHQKESYIGSDVISEQNTITSDIIMDQCADTIHRNSNLLYSPDKKGKSSGKKQTPSKKFSLFSFACCYSDTYDNSERRDRKESIYYQNQKNKLKPQKLKEAEWYKYFKELCDDQISQDNQFFFYNQVLFELRDRFKLTQQQQHKNFLHQYSLNSIEESINMHQKHQQKYEQEYNNLMDKNNPFIINQIQQNLIDNLISETNLVNENNIRVDLSQNHFTKLQSHKNKQLGIRSFLRADSVSSQSSFIRKFSAASYNNGFGGAGKRMGNTTLLVDAQNLNDNQKIYSSVFFYKNVTKLIEKQIRNKNHPLTFVREYYQESFCKKFIKKKGQISLQTISLELNTFTEIYCELIKIYYELDSLIDQFPFEDVDTYLTDENLQNFVQCILFTHEPLYDNIMFHLAYSDKDNIRSNYTENIKQMLEKDIEFFEIPVEFQLNQNTIKYHLQKNNMEFEQNDIYHLELLQQWGLSQQQQKQQQQQQQNSNSQQQPKKLLQPQPQAPSQLSKISISQASEQSSSSNNKYNSNSIPYEKVIQYFKKIDVVRSPLHKLKVLVKTTQLIDESIKDFYQQNMIKIGKKCHFDADQFIAIFLYIISQSQSYSLYEHCKLIEYFTSQGTLNSSSGYLLVTLTGCIHHIASLDMQIAGSCSVQASLTNNNFYSVKSNNLNVGDYQQNKGNTFHYSKQDLDDSDNDEDFSIKQTPFFNYENHNSSNM